MQTANRYCLDVDLGFNVDNNFLLEMSVQDIPFYGFKQFKIQKSLLDSRLTTFLESLDIKVSLAEVFYTLPGRQIPIHVDHDIIDNHCKLNFVYGEPGSMMYWWEPKNMDIPPSYQLTTIGTKYLLFSEKECRQVWQTQVGQPSLINAGQPHSVVNCTDQPRVTLSLVLYDLKKQQLLDWDDAVVIFKTWL
jgi:hypothetical protein